MEERRKQKYILVLSANQDHNGCDKSRNRFLVDTPTQTRLQLVVSARKRLHPQAAVAALIEQFPHIQDARANASESCPHPHSRKAKRKRSQSCLQVVRKPGHHLRYVRNHHNEGGIPGRVARR